MLKGSYFALNFLLLWIFFGIFLGGRDMFGLVLFVLSVVEDYLELCLA